MTESKDHIIKATNPEGASQTIQLTELDHQARITNPYLFIYINPKNDPNFMPFPSLRQSLSETLNSFPELAGTLYSSADDPSIQSIRADNGGVIWQERFSQEISAQELYSDIRCRSVPLPLELAVMDKHTLRPLQIKVTRTKDNGVVMGVTFEHIVTDAYGIFGRFFKKWTSVHKEIDFDQPIIDRSIMKKTILRISTTENVLISKKCPAGDEQFMKECLGPYCLLEMTPDNLVRLQRHIEHECQRLNPQSTIKISENTALSAIQWVTLGKVLNQCDVSCGCLTETERKESKLHLYVDLRRYLGLPTQYIGNAVHTAEIHINKQVLFGTAVHHQLRAALSSEESHWTQHQLTSCEPFSDNAFRHKCVVISNMSRLGMDSYDFGSGEPSLMMAVRDQYVIGFSGMMPTPGSIGGARIVVGLTPSLKHSLLNDSLIRTYFTLDFSNYHRTVSADYENVFVNCVEFICDQT